MKYIKKFNEDTSATGGPAGSVTGGDVYNMPVGGGSTMGPNSIKTNMGTGGINNSSDVEMEEPTKKVKDKKKSKFRKKGKIPETRHRNREPVMNWNSYLKNNI